VGVRTIGEQLKFLPFELAASEGDLQEIGWDAIVHTDVAPSHGAVAEVDVLDSADDPA